MYITRFKGWGAKALVPIPKGMFLGEYIGELLDEEAFKLRADAGGSMYVCYDDNASVSHHATFALQNGYNIDAQETGNWTRFMNQSCKHNVEAVSVCI